MDSFPVIRVPAWARLQNDRSWRGFLLLLFVLGVVCRFVVYQDMSTRPIGRLVEWQGTEPWLHAQIAGHMASDGTWLMGGTNLLVTPVMERRVPPEQWAAWSRNKLPRGAPAIYLMALSLSLTGSFALSQALALALGAAVCPIMAMTGARFFASRRVGAVAGLLAASHQALVLAAVIPGPWGIEAFAGAAVLLAFARVRGDSANPGEWALLGLVLGASLWVRSIFWWGVLLAPAAAWAWHARPTPRIVAAFALPVVLLAGGLVARNLAVHSTRAPVVGHAGWDFARTVHPGAVVRGNLPAEYEIMEQGHGRLRSVARLTLEQTSHRQVLGAIAVRKLRVFLGARDEPGTLNPQYIRRRIEPLRQMTLSPDATMAAGWGAVLFLLYRRRLPGLLAAALGITVLHGLLFDTTGGDRVLLHLALVPLIAGALIEAFDAIPARRPWVAFLFIALWGASHCLLQIDDQARGTRFRDDEFQRSALLWRYDHRPAEAQYERDDLKLIRRKEELLREYWYRRN